MGTSFNLSEIESCNIYSSIGENNELIIKTSRNGIVTSEIWPIFTQVITMIILIVVSVIGSVFVMMIPFFLLNIGPLIYMIESIAEYQIITVYRDTIQIEKKRILFNRKKLFESLKPESIKTKEFGLTLLPSFVSFRFWYKRDFIFGDGLTLPCILSIKNTEYVFFENRSVAEQKWIIDMLQKALEKNCKNVTYS